MNVKITFAAVILICATVFMYFSGGRTLQSEDNTVTSEQKKQSTTPTTQSGKTPEKIKTSYFVPYWSSFNTLSQVEEGERLFYFGIVPTIDGIDTSEPGYQALTSFNSNAGNAEKYLTLRMVESQTNAEILSTAASWQKIADASIKVVNEYGYDGVVLDLEVGLLGGLTTAPSDITDFTVFLSKEFEKEGIPMMMTLYGDTYSRSRPYDVPALEPHVTEFVIMAYDFHKSYGLPGPNFPLNGREEYKYDFMQMIEDLQKDIPSEKITITFGMFGYEWIADEQNRPLRSATARSYFEMQQIADDCENCEITIEPLSAERKITFPAEQVPGESPKSHIIWGETLESVEKKQQAAQQEGISSFSYWAWGYF